MSDLFARFDPGGLNSSRNRNRSVAQELLSPGLGSIASVVNLGELVTQAGWYVSYDHDGSKRLFESVVLAFGEPEKHILVTVSNASVTVHFEWFRFQQTFPY